MSQVITGLAPTDAANIYRLTLPLPFALNHVNLYLLHGETPHGDGWTIVDAGLNNDPSRAAWDAAFAELGIAPASIRQIVLTHTHPDHYGGAGWLQMLSRAPVYISAREQAFADAMWVHPDARDAALGTYMRLCGAPDAMRAAIAQSNGDIRAQTTPHPSEIITLDAGTTLLMGGCTFETIHAPGHSDGQIIFYDRDDRVMLCGDHVLAKITPNVGLWSPDDHGALARFEESLRTLRAYDVRLALPGHRAPIENWRERIDQLLEHHVHRLDVTRDALRGDKRTVYEVAGALFDLSRFSPHDTRFAIAEALAHLDHLEANGDAARETHDSIWHFQARA